MKQVFVAPKYQATVNDKDFKFVTMLGPWEYYRGSAVKWFTDEKGRKRCIKMENVIIERKLGHPVPRGRKVEHRSERHRGKEARLDNSRKNLRLSLLPTRESLAAKRRIQDLTGNCKGVSFYGHRYIVHIVYYGTRIRIGVYPILELALAAYGYAYQVLFNAYTPEVTIGDLGPIAKQYVIKAIIKAGIDESFLHLNV